MENGAQRCKRGRDRLRRRELILAHDFGPGCTRFDAEFELLNEHISFALSALTAFLLHT
jgi:hypothetical protein